ncbi:transketolase [Hydrogenimonas cancrithermarum]|uniref:Transketolase n=1 Tax=Hydrogenimonas cancrithermarum TaxID=2993563 RepID=A0ABN6WW44_9BACT|nr:transketolase [Hydrogenimonas cancrithermarum]BDY13241.1 transketolase [Hydrogenimonas cancrithermarum]
MDNQMMKKMADTIRFLAADMIQEANSGHPGAPMGLADIAVVLSKHLRHNPKNPKWLNRDRLVFSGGHATGLIYSLLHLWGYDLSMEDLKRFRQLGSKTPGHPEYGHTPGIEITTGPLGQGVANAVGFAMASKYCAHLVNSETAKIIDHYVYCLCGDGDLEEGISYEACAIAGHQQLDNLIMIYDSNRITIEGDTSLAWSEDVRMRFEAQGWKVYETDGHNYEQIDETIEMAKKADKPVLIIAHTVIAKGACEMAGDHNSHGSPLGEDLIARAKKAAGFDPDKKFYIPDDVLIRFRCAVEEGELAEKEWKHRLLQAPYIEQNEALERLLNPDFDAIEWPQFEPGSEVATRDSNGKILNAIAKAVPGFLGGSADLAPSNKTELKGMGDFPNGKNLHFGIREHAMAAITNGMAAYGPLLPFSATFFVFSDYLKPAARIAALSGLQHFFVWTHDSIGVGEDGPTHQPIEHLSQFRALPDFYTFRPADASENVACWKVALNLKAPSAFVCSRQKLKVLKGEDKIAFGSADKGGYLIKKRDNAVVTLVASGSEVMLALQSGCHLEEKGIMANVVSVPCYELFCEQDKAYIDTVIDPNTKVLAIEAASGNEWYRFADDVLGMNSFGASGKAGDLFEHFGFTIPSVIERVKALLG